MSSGKKMESENGCNHAGFCVFLNEQLIPTFLLKSTSFVTTAVPLVHFQKPLYNYSQECPPPPHRTCWGHHSTQRVLGSPAQCQMDSTCGLQKMIHHIPSSITTFNYTLHVLSAIEYALTCAIVLLWVSIWDHIYWQVCSHTFDFLTLRSGI